MSEVSDSCVAHQESNRVFKCVAPCAGRVVALTLAEKQKYNTSKSCNKSVEQIYVLKPWHS